MKKNLLLKIAVGAATLALAVPAFAQESTPTPPPQRPAVREEVKNTRQDVRDTRQKAKQELKDVREDAREEARNVRQEARADAKEFRDIAHQQIQNTEAGAAALIEAKRAELRAAEEQKREEFRQKIEDSKKELKARIDAKKQELKDRLAKIKDEKKKTVVEKIDNQLDALNARRMAHFSDVLGNLAAIMEKINVRVERAAARGLDVSAVKTALTAADAAIASSKTAIANQTAKTYTIAVADEAGLRQSVGVARQALQTDLKAVEQTVRDAHKAVQKAATTLAGIQGVDETDTQSAAPTPTGSATETAAQ